MKDFKILLLGLACLLILVGCEKPEKPLVTKEAALESPTNFYVYFRETTSLAPELSYVLIDAFENLIKKNDKKDVILLAKYYEKYVEKLQKPYRELSDEICQELTKLDSLSRHEDTQFEQFCNLAKIYIRCGEFPKAQEMIKKSLPCLRAKDSMEYARVLALISTLYYHAKAPEMAKKFLRSSIRILTVHSKEKPLEDLDDTVWQALQNWDDSGFIEGDFNKIQYKNPDEKEGVLVACKTRNLIENSKIAEAKKILPLLTPYPKTMAWYKIAEHLKKNNDEQGAFEALKNAVEESHQLTVMRKYILSMIVKEIILLKQKEHAMDVIQKNYSQVDNKLFPTIQGLCSFGEKLNMIGAKSDAEKVLSIAESLIPHYPLIEKGFSDVEFSRPWMFMQLAESWLEIGNHAKCVNLLNRAAELLTQPWAKDYKNRQKEIAKIALMYAQAEADQKILPLIEPYDQDFKNAVFRNCTDYFVQKQQWNKAEFCFEKITDQNYKSFFKDYLLSEKFRTELKKADLVKGVPGFKSWDEFLSVIDKDPKEFERYSLIFKLLLEKNLTSKAEELMERIKNSNWEISKKVAVLERLAMTSNFKKQHELAIKILSDSFAIARQSPTDKPSKEFHLQSTVTILYQFEQDAFSEKGKKLAQEILEFQNHKN
ncbi:MAG: tetratricopeptide repeat protein [Verrucomicrobiota bacterium]